MIRGFKVAQGWEDRDIQLPVRSTEFSAAYDFHAAEDVTIAPGKIELIPTGVKAYMQPDEVLLLFPRSSTPKKIGVRMPHSVGVIDADYYGNPDNDGHIMFQYENTKDVPVIIRKGTPIGQGMFTFYLTADEGSAIEANTVRTGGFGSTDRGVN